MLPVLRANLERVQARVAAAARRAGRDEAEITLVAVTKMVPAEIIAAAHALGVRDVGENRAEEALPKQEALPADLRWHMIGHIQRRKAREAVGNFHLVHSVDSVRLAQELDKRASAAHVTVEVLLELNVSGEESKYGFAAVTRDAWSRLAEEAAAVAGLAALRVRGLMTMAPFTADPSEARRVFAVMPELREFLRREVPGPDWTFLSMGMTNDFEVAIEEGATHVRIGTAIFGSQPTP